MLVNLLNELFMYEDDINVIETIAKAYKEWCVANKYFGFEYEILDCREKFHTDDIIIIHNIWKESTENYTMDNGHNFINNLKIILMDY